MDRNTKAKLAAADDRVPVLIDGLEVKVMATKPDTDQRAEEVAEPASVQTPASDGGGSLMTIDRAIALTTLIVGIVVLVVAIRACRLAGQGVAGKEPSLTVVEKSDDGTIMLRNTSPAHEAVITSVWFFVTDAAERRKVQVNGRASYAGAGFGTRFSAADEILFDWRDDRADRIEHGRYTSIEVPGGGVVKLRFHVVRHPQTHWDKLVGELVILQAGHSPLRERDFAIPGQTPMFEAPLPYEPTIPARP